MEGYKAEGKMNTGIIAKKSLCVLSAVLFMACSLAACAGRGIVNGDVYSQSSGTIRIVTTIFPEYDWVINILGDNPADIEVTQLLGNGVDLHSYQPSVGDIMEIASCDLFIYVGGESDSWVEDALAEAVNKDKVTVNLIGVLGDKAKEEEIKEGMDADKTGNDTEDEPEYDEHVWLSLRNAKAFVTEIANAIALIDADNAVVYTANAQAYNKQLAMLDDEYRMTVDAADTVTLLFGDRFPFRYMTDDYGLDYYAAFAGCSAETEASFETIVFLADKVDELSLHTIMTIDGTDHRIAETIRDNTMDKDQQILTLDSMQSITSQDVADGVTYLSVMKDNLAVLRSALQ